MAAPTPNPPKWSDGNLRRHHKKHATGNNAGCFAEMLGRSSPPATVHEYEGRSLAAISGAWAEYEAEKWDRSRDGYAPTRATFVDDSLVVCVTDLARTDVVTCFHEHFDRAHGVEPGRPASAGRRILRYQRQVELDEKGKVLMNVRRIRGF